MLIILKTEESISGHHGPAKDGIDFVWHWLGRGAQVHLLCLLSQCGQVGLKIYIKPINLVKHVFTIYSKILTTLLTMLLILWPIILFNFHLLLCICATERNANIIICKTLIIFIWRFFEKKTVVLLFVYFRLKGVSEYVNLRTGMPCHLHPTSALFGMG